MERANTRTSTIRISSDGQPPYSVFNQGHVGDIKYISALNNFHTRRVPGEFHANPVVIWNSHSTTTDGRTNKTSYGSYYKNVTLEGDVLGYFAQNAGYDPRSLVQYYTLWDQNASVVAQNRAFSAAAAPEFDVGVQLGELKETLSGFAQPLQALRKFIRDYNKLLKTGVPGVTMNPRKAGNSVSGLDMLAGSWLEWRYGIRPVIQTLEDLIEHVKGMSYSWSGKMLRKTGKFQTVKTIRPSHTGMPYLFSVTCSCTIDIEHRYYAKLYYTEDAPLSFEQRYGIDLSNALPVAWEIVPLSFIVDRIWKIGDWIQAMKFYTHPRTTKGMVVSKKTTMKGQALCENVSLFDKKVSFEQNPTHFLQIEHLERQVIPTPSVSILPPVALSHHSMSMLLDEITLTWQRLPKMKRR